MMISKKNGVTMTMAAALAVGGLALPSIGAEKMDESSQRDNASALTQDPSQDVKILKGTVVNLRTFLTSDTDSGNPQVKGSDKDKTDHTRGHAYATEADDDAPLGLLVKDEGMIDMLSTEQTYLIISKPGDDNGEDAQDQARDLVGKQVAITGRVVERGSLSGIVINSIMQDSTKQASAEDRSY